MSLPSFHPEETVLIYNEVTWDIETYPNIFTLAGQDLVTGKTFLFEISWRLDQRYEMMEFLRRLKMNGYSMVGYNSLGFDYPVLHFIIENIDHITVEMIYEKAMQIINAPFHARFAHVIWEKDQHIPQIDLFKVHHFDNPAKSTSLKVLEFNMMMDNVEDLPFPPGTFLLDEQMDVLIKYGDHDIKATTLFHGHSEKHLAFRRDLSIKYDRNMMNFNDTKIGKEYFISELEKHSPGICYAKENGKRRPRQTKREQIRIGDVLVPYLKFKTHPMKHIHLWFQQQVITPLVGSDEIELKGFFKDVSATLNGFQFDFGAGGIHGSIRPCIIEETENEMILDIDVASFYPNLAISNRFFPAHLGEKFCDIYQDVYLQRKKYAKKTAENEMLKLALNGVYGDSNNKYSPFFDPQYTLSITINGQLLLCMLAEQLMSSPEIKMLQINTDGLTIKFPRILLHWVRETMRWWEGVTKLELEEAEYSRMFVRDVNNYIGEFSDGKLKRIGAYALETALENPSTRELAWHKNQSSIVVMKAAQARLVHGTDIRQFVENHKNLYDFLLRTKVPRSSELIGVDYEGKETKHQNVSRYYISMMGESLIKRMPPTPAQVQKDPDAPKRNIGINAGWRISVANNICHVEPDNIEYEFYIKQAEKLVNPILNGGCM